MILGRLLRLFKSDFSVALGIALLALFLNYIFWIDGFHGGFNKLELHEADQLSYASLARGILRGDGLVDQCIYPISFSKVKEFPQPYLRGTLFPFLIVPFFMLFGISDLWAIVPVWLCYGLLIFFAYLLSKKYLSRNWSLLVAAFTAFNPVIVRLSIRSLPDLPTAVSLAILLWLLLRKSKPLWIGVFFGLAYYVKPTTMFFLPVILYGLENEQTWKVRFRSYGMFFLGWFLLLWPWMIRNMLVAQNPFYSYLGADLLSHTPSFERYYVWDKVNLPEPVGFALTHPWEMIVKMKRVSVHLFTLCRPPAMWVLLFSLLLPIFFRAPAKRSLRRRRIVLLTIACGVLPLLLTHVEPRYFAPVLVPLLILTFRFLVIGMEGRGAKNAIATGSAGLILILYLVFCVVGLMQLSEHYYEQGWVGWPEIDYLKKRVLPDQLIACDVAHAVAWRADRNTVFMPAEIEDLQAIDQIHPVDFLYFRDPVLSDSLRSFESSPWFQTHYAILREFPTETKARLYRRRGSRVGALVMDQLLRIDEQFYVKRNGFIFPVTSGVIETVPLCVLPEGTVRVREDTTSGGFLALTDSMQIVGLAGARSIPLVTPEDGFAVDFALTPSGEGLSLLMDDGQIRNLGDAEPLTLNKDLQDPIRIELTPSGKGCLALSSEGVVAAAGDGQVGYKRFFGRPIATDLELAPGSSDYYILDGYGSTHPSSTEQKLIMGPYDPGRKWALSLKILDNWEAYVLTDKGEIIRCSISEPK